MKLPGGSPFGRAEWFALLAEAGGKTPFVAIARDEKGAAALPLMQGDSGLEQLSNWYAFTWQPLFEGMKDTAKIRAIAEGLKAHTHRITLAPVPDEDSSAAMLVGAFSDAGWKVSQERCDTNHILEVSERTYAEYLAGRPGQLRTTLKRKAKKVEVRIADSFDAEIWASYEAIYAESWKPEEGDPALLRKFAEDEGAAGRIRLGVATHEGVPVAAQFWTVESGTAFIHKLAHLESHKNLSAGTTLTAALFERVIDEDKAQLVDFGTGNDRYKADWMEQIRARYRIDCLNTGNPRSWPVIAKQMLRRLAPAKPQG
ncbi:GNAT family N-acetyltransferase [Altererythrobacter sp. ZODW24]|uniref:GNAT family N-acetyltransferase n=1 Tax=Altererythrobacter sp. ZODW24 TaxID=2185142 RepID=UPI000DF7A305|nr:GNAT family N-acetyltransferase [Altererythrobacter sp. ZODW24]